MDQSHFPAEGTRLIIPLREDGEHSSVHGFTVAVLFHVVSVHWAYSMICSAFLRHDQIKLFVIGILLSLDEILDERETSLLDIEAIKGIEITPGCKVVD